MKNEVKELFKESGKLIWQVIICVGLIVFLVALFKLI